MTDTPDTPDVHVDQAVGGVIRDVTRLVELTKRWPHLVQAQLQEIELASNMLALEIAWLKDWQDAQMQLDEPANLLGAG